MFAYPLTNRHGRDRNTFLPRRTSSERGHGTSMLVVSLQTNPQPQVCAGTRTCPLKIGDGSRKKVPSWSLLLTRMKNGPGHYPNVSGVMDQGPIFFFGQKETLGSPLCAVSSGPSTNSSRRRWTPWVISPSRLHLREKWREPLVEEAKHRLPISDDGISVHVGFLLNA